MENELRIVDKRMPPTDDNLPAETESPNAVVLMALRKNYDPALIEKLMDLAERAERNQARRDFFEAFAAFKAEAPPVKKDKYNKFFDSWYTSLGNLLDTYNPILGKVGLSVSFPTPEQTDKSMTGVCRLSHKSGHYEEMKITAPIDQAAVGKVSGQKSRNPIQDIKSTFTYLRSATCEGVLGVSGTEASAIDDDGNSAGRPEEFITEKQLSTIIDLINAKEVDEILFCEYMKVEKVEEILSKDFNKAIIALNKKKKPERQPGDEP